MMVKHALRWAAAVGLVLIAAEVQAGGRHARRSHASADCRTVQVVAPCCTADVSAPPAAVTTTDANAPAVATAPGERRSFSVEPSAGLPTETLQPPMSSAPSYSSRSRGTARASQPSYLMQKADSRRYSTP